jgi:PAS domain S-box-containing protein
MSLPVPNREVGWFELRIQPMPEGLFILSIDITERKQAEDKLAASEDRYRDLVENSQDLICTHDLEGFILSVNPFVESVLGYSTDDLLQMNLRDIPAPEVRGAFDKYLTDIKENGHAKGSMLVQTKAGEQRIWEFNNTRRTEGVDVPLVRGMARDVTEAYRSRRRCARRETALPNSLPLLQVLSAHFA